MTTTNAAPDSSVPAAIAGLSRPAKVMVTKIGLDGHDRGSRLVASFLRDAGMEVIYTDHLLVPKLMDALHKAGMDDVVVIVGGIVPDEDERMLLERGVAQVFHPGCSRTDIVEGIADHIVERRRKLGEV